MTEAPAQVVRDDDPEILVRRYEEVSREYPARPDVRVLRLLDVVLGTAGLIVFSPFLLIACTLVRASGGPALYRGHRVGRCGELFTMLKIRTMPPDAERRLGAVGGVELTRLTSDEVTRVGRVLRATKFDELPQLWNVVRGDMSLVGPRPVRPAFFLELIEQMPAYWQRLAVRPGLTGLAQLRMTRETSWEEKMAHDLEYIADCSLSLYVQILATTVAAWLARPVWRAYHRELRVP
ncbi:MAG TPA: sugar transferase [Solirubrobacteraceae bacterium]|jgi:lipopolysaccharide/colanic/teichoic acid biosynthesis glycosyltransferase|nr:sugar transferase [Solirubrobacteraceae bacterium]